MRTPKSLFFGAASIFALTAAAALAQGAQGAQGAPVTIPAENLKSALDAYIRQSGVQLIYNVDDIAGVTSRAVHGLPAETALANMLEGTGLAASRDPSGAVIITRAAQAERLYFPVTETIVVTGSRIRNANEPSTPVISLPVAQLLATTPDGVPEALDKMPIFAAGSTPNNATTGANGRGNNAPGYFLNLRNLGAIRTLILQDGHRVPGTFYDTMVDVDMLPQMLTSRVEVVTGGASAVYGSDAVTGVVNFILDKQFDGFKTVAQGGISGHGDARSLYLGVADGQDLAGGHLIWSVEYRDRAALPDAAMRPLGNLGTSIVERRDGGEPSSCLSPTSARAILAPGGLIVSGPGKGLAVCQRRKSESLRSGEHLHATRRTFFSIGGRWRHRA